MTERQLRSDIIKYRKMMAYADYLSSQYDFSIEVTLEDELKDEYIKSLGDITPDLVRSLPPDLRPNGLCLILWDMDNSSHTDPDSPDFCCCDSLINELEDKPFYITDILSDPAVESPMDVVNWLCNKMTS